MLHLAAWAMGGIDAPMSALKGPAVQWLRPTATDERPTVAKLGPTDSTGSTGTATQLATSARLVETNAKSVAGTAIQFATGTATGTAIQFATGTASTASIVSPRRVLPWPSGVSRPTSPLGGQRADEAAAPILSVLPWPSRSGLCRAPCREHCQVCDGNSSSACNDCEAGQNEIFSVCQFVSANFLVCQFVCQFENRI